MISWFPKIGLEKGLIKQAIIFIIAYKNTSNKH